MRLRLLCFSIAFVALFSLSPHAVSVADAQVQEILKDAKSVAARTRPIETFQIGHPETVFGDLTFLGGLELLASDRKVGGLSGLLSLDEGQGFLAVTDNGHWVSGEVDQAADGAPLDIRNIRFAPLLGADGKTLQARWGHDTEALTLASSGLYVTAEFKNAIYHYPWPLTTGKEHMLGQVSLPADVRSLPRNAGLESLEAAPEGSALHGKMIAVAESSRSDAHDFSAFIIGPDGFERFSIKRRNRFDATDAAFLPNGDLILMERRFNLRDLIGLRLRRFDAASIIPGAVLEGDVMLEADFNYQIDNMEALAVHQTGQGETILTLLSDNNRSMLQRTVFLRFRLND
ncbi:esterase-like activity of phytase family protein [uncultured Roseibium sp.]|uniref:esterase-like activity of phytase family protein n=1 Tax=uncultured Roseibium sp. TaxID=1936171 RepID=UPI00261C8298|nr:esterase-like activity of phytase family protein [uncultured Roseibium sp.]